MMEAFIAIVAGLVMCVAIMFFFLLIYKEFSAIERGPNIRVVKKGKIPTEKVECLHCHSIIEYDTMKVEHEPIMDKLYPYIVCPVCNEQIMLGREKGEEL